MKPEMIVNGGVDISLKAHAADAHFRSIGWEIGFGGRPTRCPDCNDSFR